MLKIERTPIFNDRGELIATHERWSFPDDGPDSGASPGGHSPRPTLSATSGPCNRLLGTVSGWEIRPRPR